MPSRNAYTKLLIPLLAVTLAGCTGGSVGLLKLGKAAPLAPQAPVAAAGNINGNNTSTLVGVVRVPSAQLISNHGAGLIGNNSSGVIGNNGSALIGNNAAGFRVANMNDKLVPLEGAAMTVTDAAGRPLTTQKILTDAQGRYAIPGVKAERGPVFVRASRTQGPFTLSLLSIAMASAGGEIRVDLDPIATLVAKKTARLLESGKVSAKTLNPEALAEIAEKIETAVTDRDLAAAVVQTEAAAEKTFDTLLDTNPTLKKNVGEVAEAAQAPSEASPAPAPSPTATPRRSGGSSGGSSAPAPTATGETSVETVGLHTLVRIAGDDIGAMALGTSPLTAGLGRVNGLALGPDGTIYVADGVFNHIRALPPGAPSEVLAGAAEGTEGPVQSSIPATAARFRTPVGLIYDADRDALVVCDSGNNRLRTFAPDGRITTLAGGGNATDPNVGSGTNARLDEPWGLATDAAGNLYFSERGNGRVRKLSRTGALTTLATLTADSVGAIAVDPVNNCLWVADGDQVRAISDLTGTPTLLPDPVVTAAGTSPGRRITALACDQAGVLYVLQTGTTPAGRIDTVLWRVAVTATGAARADRGPEAIAGSGAEGAAASDFVAPTSALSDARTQLLGGAGDCGLLLDLALGGDEDALSGQLYLGHSVDDGTDRWGQVLRLEAVE